ncbi:TRAM domain-containing protein [Halococcus thailandensis]|uniref:Deoxyribonuclease/rho domain-containing protein n=1 Tax=Halococcus thailandensis JCM 13552 TaxID=1227457 RepID=M0N7M2_9EURY|nr:TRAM domain-containing protein [Halococcus thailandensis]EMA53119.1 deoxyribonuclease/rho domain-containing protein [Halococcus thailandensis JCM 13552]
MADCPLADECPSFSERVAGMGCQHYGNRGGAEWCNHYSQPIRELKSQPVTVGEELVVTVEDMHESGAGVGRTEDGFIVFVDGVLPDARSRVKITKVRSNHARADEIERLPMDAEDEADDGADEDDGEAEDAGDADDETDGRPKRRQRLGSRENFWGG